MSNLSLSTLIDRATGDTVEAKYIVHGSAKAWANLNGTGTIALRDSFNVSSVVDNGTGDYTFNFSNAMSNANFVGLVTPDPTGDSLPTRNFTGEPFGQTASTVKVLTKRNNSSFGEERDLATIHTAINGDLA
jgi:hypothetical protein